MPNLNFKFFAFCLKTFLILWRLFGVFSQIFIIFSSASHRTFLKQIFCSKELFVYTIYIKMLQKPYENPSQFISELKKKFWNISNSEVALKLSPAIFYEFYWTYLRYFWHYLLDIVRIFLKILSRIPINLSQECFFLSQ